MDSDPHVHVEVQLLLHMSEGFFFLMVDKKSCTVELSLKKQVMFFTVDRRNRQTDRIVLIMARPISTQCRACARCGSGTPDTQ